MGTRHTPGAGARVVPVSGVQRKPRSQECDRHHEPEVRGRVITGQRVAVAAETLADFIAEFCLSGGKTFIEQRIGPGG